MTRVPIGASVTDGMKGGHGMPMSDEIMEKYGERLAERGMPMFSQFEGAEILCEKYNVSRKDCENLAYLSHKRATEAIKNGYFDREIAVIKGHDKDGKEIEHKQDEGVRPSTSLEGLAKLKSLKEL